MYDFDFFVIGGGSGGVRAARIAAGHGAKVGLAEEKYLGGTCVNVGCVPKKLLSYGAHVGEDIEAAHGYGWSFDGVTHDWQTLIRNKNTEIERLNGIYRTLLEKPGVQVFDGRASFVDAHTLQIGDQTVTAAQIMIATGGTPRTTSEPGAQEYGLVSDDVFYLNARPQHVVVAGGGYIAVEFASIFKGLGSDVCLIYRGPQVLNGFDTDVRETLCAEFEKKGIDFQRNTIISSIEKNGDGPLPYTITLTNGQQRQTGAVIYAIGRKPNTAGLGLDKAGVTTGSRGEIPVNKATYQTAVPHIYAVGDVTDRVNLTPVALAEGHCLADRLFGDPAKGTLKACPNYDNIPTAVFSHPPVGTVGLTEAQALDRGHTVRLYRSSFRPLKHTISGVDERMMMKLVVDDQTDIVLGCHIVGMDAPEIIQGIGIAITTKATKAQFDATIGVHPTAAEELVTMRTVTEIKRPEDLAA